MRKNHRKFKDPTNGKNVMQRKLNFFTLFFSSVVVLFEDVTNESRETGDNWELGIWVGTIGIICVWIGSDEAGSIGMIITVTFEEGVEADSVEERIGEEIEMTGSDLGTFFFANQGWLRASSAVILSAAFFVSIRLIRSFAGKLLARKIPSSFFSKIITIETFMIFLRVF